jgi:hypothetical protein
MPDSAAARHRLIDAVLSQAASGDSHAVGGATRDALASFSVELVALIGQRGVRSLYDRSLHLASARYAWLPPLAGAPSDEPFIDMQRTLAEHSADEALGAAAAVLIELTSLLAALIGEALTERLMRTAWKQYAQDYPSAENRK